MEVVLWLRVSPGMSGWSMVLRLSGRARWYRLGRNWKSKLDGRREGGRWLYAARELRPACTRTVPAKLVGEGGAARLRQEMMAQE
jgi:hypothetical protein